MHRVKVMVMAVTVATLGCGDAGSGGPGGGGADDDGPGPAPVVLEWHCAPATTIPFVDTHLGQTSMALVSISASDAAANDLGIAIDGPAASEFATNLNCVGDDLCLVQVSLAPTSTGAKQATLHVRDQSVTLTAMALEVQSGFVSTIANIDTFTMPQLAGGASFMLGNDGGVPITLTDLSHGDVGEAFTDSWSTNSCPQPITDGGACQLDVLISQYAAGCVDTTVRITGDSATIDLPISSTLIRVAKTSTFAASGGGTVTSDVGLIDCHDQGSHCSANVDAADSVTFTATPDAGSVFAGWNDYRCDVTPTCTLPVNVIDPIVVAAGFAPIAAVHAVHVTFAGAGTGAITTNSGSMRCTGSCTFYVSDGETATITAVGNSKFDGYGGACVGTTPLCDLGLVVADRDVTVTFSKDDHEQSTRRSIASGVARYIADGDMILVDTTTFVGRVLRLRPSGDIVWSRIVPSDVVAPASHIAISGAGDTYMISIGELTRIDSSGAVRWHVDLGQRPGPMAVTSTGLAVATSAGIQLIAASDGSTTRTLALSSQPQGIGVGADGTIAANIEADVHRFTSAGVELPIVTLPSMSAPLAITEMAFDAAGALYVMRGYTSLGSGSQAKLSRIATNGSITYTTDLDTTGPDGSSTGGGDVVGATMVVVAGQVVSLRRHQSSFSSRGAIVESFDATTGARSWFVEKAARPLNAGRVAGFVSGHLVVTPSGDVQLLGLRSDELRVDRPDPTLENLTP